MCLSWQFSYFVPWSMNFHQFSKAGAEILMNFIKMLSKFISNFLTQFLKVIKKVSSFGYSHLCKMIHFEIFSNTVIF